MREGDTIRHTIRFPLRFTIPLRLLMTGILWMLIFPWALAWAEDKPSSPGDDSMIMFVGEDLDVFSLASRRREGAWQAPAVTGVVTRDEIRVRGIRTLSQALSMTPGFSMSQKEWGTQPYLRGVPNSILLLFDTVPQGSDTSKSLHPLDKDLSLAGVKRIEIIRGPGSVLWGPDAFAGVVNVEPMTGKDLRGAEAGIISGWPDDNNGFFANLGHDGGYWDAFLSVSGRKAEEDERPFRIKRFWGEGRRPIPPAQRLEDGIPDSSRYVEVSGNASLRDWITISGRLSENRHPYTMQGSDADLSWPESRSAPSGFIKIEGKKDLDHRSALRLSGYYSSLNPEYEIIDRTFEERETTLYGEALYDRSFMAGSGLLTTGVSYRDRQVKDALIWESYLPDFLGQDNRFFLPRVSSEDYGARLLSLFGQYSHKLGQVDLTLGLRYDEHNIYKDHLSYNAAAVWSPSAQWVVKLLYGNAYRTPFARQLIDEDEPELENISSLSAQLGWRPSKKASLTLTGFFNEIDNHIMEDPYAGLSIPNKQRIKGIEAEGQITPFKELTFSANVTLLDNSGPEETYKYNDVTFVRPDGSVERHYIDLNYPYDAGSKSMVNLMADWRPWDRFTAFARLYYTGPRYLAYARGESVEVFPRTQGVWLMDVSMTFKDIAMPGLDLSVSVNNIFARDYETPGTYQSIPGEPFTLEAVLRLRW